MLPVVEVELDTRVVVVVNGVAVEIPSALVDPEGPGLAFQRRSGGGDVGLVAVLAVVLDLVRVALDEEGGVELLVPVVGLGQAHRAVGELLAAPRDDVEGLVVNFMGYYPPRMARSNPSR